MEYHILYDGPDHWAIDRLEAFRGSPVTVRVHRLPNPWARIGPINGFPPATFFRFAIPDVLAGHDRAIYLDCDVVVEADLGPLFDADLGGLPVGAVPCVLTVIAALRNGTAKSGGVTMNADSYFRDVLGLDTPERQLGYRQAGVQLLDLAMLRRMEFATLVTAEIDRLGDRLAYCDQCAINLVLRDRIAPIEPRWNVSPYALHRNAPDLSPPALRQLLLGQRQKGILHFGGEKPWRELFVPGGLRWWRAALSTDARGYFVGLLGKLRPDFRLAARHLRYAMPMPLRRLLEPLYRAVRSRPN